MKAVSRVVLAGIAVTAWACASAVREPPPIAAIAGADGTAAGGDAAQRLAAAERAFEGRPNLASVERARALFLAVARDDEHDIAGLLGAARATAWLIEHADDADRRRELAIEGVDLGQWCVRRAPDNPECGYRLALALGQQARERPATATDGLERMVALLGALTEAAPQLDDAGPDRVLALVLLRAPGWPTGPGDPELALEHAAAAVARFPDYPPNRLALAEAEAENGLDGRARATLDAARRLAAEANTAGDREAADWLAEADRLLDELG